MLSLRSPYPAWVRFHGGEVFDSPSVRSDWLTDWKDIQPRFGFAWRLDNKTVMRGGYGIYYRPDPRPGPTGC